jgi:hypothetical protein
VLTCGLVYFSRQNGAFYIDGKQAAFAGSAILLWIFLASHSILNGVQNYFAFSALMQISACCIGAMICFSNRNIHDYFFGYFRLFLMICSASFLLTVIMSSVSGLATLHLFDIDTSKYKNVYSIYFPATQSYGLRYNFGIFMPRLGAWFRESGIAQAFFAFAILSLPSLARPRDWVSLALLFVGGIGTQSTTGLAVVGLSLAIRLLCIKKMPFAVRLMMIAAAVGLAFLAIDFALHDRSVGFAAKSDSMSYWDRYIQVQRGLDAFNENPLGYGAYSEHIGAGINLLSALGGIGIFGLVFVLINCIVAVCFAEDRLIKAACVSAIFFTSLTSQPLLDSGIVYIFYAYLGTVRRPLHRGAGTVSSHQQIPLLSTHDSAATAQ